MSALETKFKMLSVTPLELCKLAEKARVKNGLGHLRRLNPRSIVYCTVPHELKRALALEPQVHPLFLIQMFLSRLHTLPHRWSESVPGRA